MPPTSRCEFSIRASSIRKFLPPVQKGSGDVMRAWAEKGVMVMPYTNPRLWDTNSAGWVFAKDHACRWRTGDYRTVSYQGKPCAIMCPSSDKWKECVWKWSAQVAATGANAVYYKYFTWGVLPGWFDRWDIGEERFASQRSVIARLAKIRRAAADYMVYGSLDGEVDFVEKPQVHEYKMNYLWRPTTWIDKVHQSDLHGTVWTSRKDSSRAIFVANAARSVRTVSFRLPAGGFKVVSLPETDGVSYSEKGGIGTLVLPGSGIAFLKSN